MISVLGLKIKLTKDRLTGENVCFISMQRFQRKAVRTESDKALWGLYTILTKDENLWELTRQRRMYLGFQGWQIVGR
jgi:hypothetical protein